MSPSKQQRLLDVISGRTRGIRAMLLRGALRTVEPLYAGAMTVRNALFDEGWKRARPLGRPAVSVGNLTTGGTGKTPIVAWLARSLVQSGRRPVILLRGYKSSDAGSDEAIELRSRVGPDIPVIPNPDRIAGAQEALGVNSAIDCFILDDGFQHRRAQRQVDLVLIDATCPFGFGHVLPRGLLREPITGLRRASAVILTRCELVDENALQAIESRVREIAPQVLIARCETRATSLSDGRSLEALRDTPVVAFCGIGNPEAFRSTLLRAGLTIAHFQSFDDHHAYTPAEIESLHARADGRPLITTMKDLARLPASLGAIGLEIEPTFSDTDAQALLGIVRSGIERIK
ncbi:MAG TPA: tetraacyldisaccharide 4'-kinase [Tepidisphaeraceae bacterium]|nr:tetraacyldisaccharide 4'-kinase [Tepidisphaeraceae bacterium]